jgi:hypothetical protein
MSVTSAGSAGMRLPACVFGVVWADPALACPGECGLEQVSRDRPCAVGGLCLNGLHAPQGAVARPSRPTWVSLEPGQHVVQVPQVVSGGPRVNPLGRADQPARKGEASTGRCRNRAWATCARLPCPTRPSAVAVAAWSNTCFKCLDSSAWLPADPLQGRSPGAVRCRGVSTSAHGSPGLQVLAPARRPARCLGGPKDLLGSRRQR